MQASIEYVLRRMLFQPHSQTEFTLTAVLAALVFVLVLTGVGGSLNLAAAHMVRSLAVLAIGLAVELGVLGFLGTQRLPGWALPAAAAAVLLAVVVPMACVVMKGKYPSALFSVLMAMAAAALVALMIHVVSGAAGLGGRSVGTGIERNREVERFLQH